MRILLVAPALARAHVVACQLIEHLSERHTFAVVAAAGAADAGARARLTAGATVADIVPSRERRVGAGGPDLRTLADRVRRASIAFRPDVVHLESAWLAPLAGIGGAACVLGCHEASAATACEGLDRVSTCVVDSEHDRRQLAGLLPLERIEVIGTAIDAERYAYRRIAHGARLVFTGDLGRPDDLDAARRLARSILPAIRRQIPRAELLVATTGSAEAARKLTRCAGVRVEGRLGDLRPSVWGAALYVSPVADGAGRPPRILEALALGTPVVASTASLSRLDEIVSGHHLLTADRDADVAHGVVLLMHEPVVANTLARHARALVEAGRTWATAAEQYDALYRRLVQMPSARAA